MENNLTISVENAKKAYNEGNENEKKFMENLFGKDVFQPKDIIDRIKTFEDACRELGDEHPFVLQYDFITNEMGGHLSKDLKAYLQMRIIVTALNEGWEPQFTVNEHRYYPWFYFYTKEEYKKMNDEEKKDCCLLGGAALYGSSAGLAFVRSSNGVSLTCAILGSRLCLKNENLAKYCGKQFIEIWKDFICITK